jgi:hypothetical protein
MTTIKMKHTPVGKSYWGDTGAFQEEYDKLNNDLVPMSGAARSVHGELIRGIGRIYYDYCNNGNCNIQEVRTQSCSGCGGSGWEDETCWNCDGSGEVDEYDDEDECIGTQPCDDCGGSGHDDVDCSWCDGECDEVVGVEINDYYQKFFKLMESEIGSDVCADVEEFIKENKYEDMDFGDEAMNIYDKMCDKVIFHVLTTEDKPLPSNYPEKPLDD